MTKWVSTALVACLTAVSVPFAATQLQAASKETVELWSGLTTATSEAEMRAFRSRLTENKVDLFAGCRAHVGYRFVKKKLVSIILLGLNKEAPCIDFLLRDMTAKYGQPNSKEVPFGSSIGTASTIIDTSSSKSGYIWRTGVKRILLVQTPGKPSGYNLIFTVRPEKYLY